MSIGLYKLDSSLTACVVVNWLYFSNAGKSFSHQSDPERVCDFRQSVENEGLLYQVSSYLKSRMLLRNQHKLGLPSIYRRRIHRGKDQLFRIFRIPVWRALPKLSH